MLTPNPPFSDIPDFIHYLMHTEGVHESLWSPISMVWTLYQDGKIDELNKLLYERFPDYYRRPVEPMPIPEDKQVQDLLREYEDPGYEIEIENL